MEAVGPRRRGRTPAKSPARQKGRRSPSNSKTGIPRSATPRRARTPKRSSSGTPRSTQPASRASAAINALESVSSTLGAGVGRDTPIQPHSGVSPAKARGLPPSSETRTVVHSVTVTKPPRDSLVTQCFVVALLLRIGGVIYAEWQDVTMLVKYTDIDYVVFTDAARFVAEGLSPYFRATYRYTPLLAWMLTPNVFLHPVFGKMVFVICDLVVGFLQLLLLKLQDPLLSSKNCCKYLAAWLFCPIVFNISTRGNAESIVSVLVLSALYFVLTDRIRLGAFLYGLSVHFKIYPIVYSLPFIVFLDRYSNRKQGVSFKPLDYVNKNQVEFTIISASTFFALLAFFYKLYGWDFLFETYLYHIGRTDPRHNFSVYFYQMYLTHGSPRNVALGLASFVPQIVLLTSFAFRYGKKDLTFCLFVQTMTFVAFNKVCTVQYFIWHLTFLPMVCFYSRLNLRWTGLVMLVCWFAAELHWLAWAYKLEFKGENSFLEVWAAGIVFFLVNIMLLLLFVMNHDSPPQI